MSPLLPFLLHLYHPVPPLMTITSLPYIFHLCSIKVVNPCPPLDLCLHLSINIIRIYHTSLIHLIPVIIVSVLYHTRLCLSVFFYHFHPYKKKVCPTLNHNMSSHLDSPTPKHIHSNRISISLYHNSLYWIYALSLYAENVSIVPTYLSSTVSIVLSYYLQLFVLCFARVGSRHPPLQSPHPLLVPMDTTLFPISTTCDLLHPHFTGNWFVYPSSAGNWHQRVFVFPCFCT